MGKHLLRSMMLALMVLVAGNAWADDKTVVKYSFDDSTSPAFTAGSRVTFDYDKTSVITSTKFLNAWNNTNGDPGVSTLSLGSTDLSGESWTLSFEWAACGGCNSKPDHTTLKAGDTSLFDLTGNSNWNTTVTITYAGSDGSMTLPVPACNKSYRFSAAVGNLYNTTDYWHHVVVTGSDEGVKMTITNSSSGTVVVENIVLSETNVSPTSLLIEPCCGGAIGIDELSLTYYVEGEVVQTPTATYTSVNGIERTITAACETEGATIQYSTDGVNYTDGASVTVSKSGNVYFKAVKGASESDVLTFEAEAGEAITLNAPAIVRSDNTTVTITADQSNLLLSPTATIYYQYGEESGSFTGSKVLTVAADATITAYAEATGYTTSETSECAVALFPTDVKQIENTDTRTSGWEANAFSEETFVVSDRTYAALMLDGVKWGENVYLQTDGAWGLRANGNWYINSNTEESWLLIRNMKKGDIIVANTSFPASSMVNAAYSKYSFGTQHAYEVAEDGDVELAFMKFNAATMDYFYGVYTYSRDSEFDINNAIKNADLASTEGWTENVSSQYRDYGIYAIGGAEMVRFAPPTADETHLTTEFAFGFEARWATNFASYIQTIAELPAGNYKLTYDVENVNANTAAANYNNLFTVTVGEKVFMDESTEWMSDKTAWTQHTIRFTVEEAGPVTISFGYGTGENNFPASDTPALYVSHVKLNTYDPVADNKDELTEVITYAEALAADELKTEGVEEFADAISTAKSVLETATTAEELANAIDALRAAITTFTLANQFIYDGVVYIIDAETDKKMAAGHEYGTRGIVNDLGLDLTLVSDETTRTVTIDSRVSNGEQDHFLGSNLYMDSKAYNWILQYRGFGFYISDGTKYISLDENDNLVLSETPHEWILVTSDGVKEQLLSEMADATAESPVDATFFIKANNFNRNDLRIAESWTVSADCTNSNLCGGSDVNRCAESYHSTFTISQTIEGLPAGVYKMTAQGFYRQDEALEEDAPVFFANDAVAALPAKAGEENNMSDASAAFTSGLYTIEPIEFVVGEEGVVTLGVKNESATNQWIIFDNFQLTYYGAEQPEPLNPDLIELALDVDRYTGMGYNVTEAEVDFTAAKEFLGVDEITSDMLRIVNPDDTEISDYATYDGWFNAEGVATTWGDNTKICVKFFQAITDGKYEICDMNGADEVGKTYTVKWALVANDKKVFYTINVKFVDKPAIAITYDDLNIVETVTSDFSFEVGTCYQGSTATVDVAAILAELGVASLDDVTIYAVQSDKSLDDNYKLGTTDGWRNAAGDWQGWGSDAYFYVKADFSAAESQLYQVGTMDPESNTNIAADDVYTAKYVFVKGDDAHSAVELDVVVTMTSAVGINGIALDAENSAVYDLTGRRVKNVVKGNLYIVNGKKVLVK